MWGLRRKPKTVVLLLLDTQKLSLYALKAIDQSPQLIADAQIAHDMPICTPTFLNSIILAEAIGSFIKKHTLHKPLLACSLSSSLAAKQEPEKRAQHLTLQLLIQRIGLHCITISSHTQCLKSLADYIGAHDKVDETITKHKEAFGLFNQVQMTYGNSLLY